MKTVVLILSVLLLSMGCTRKKIVLKSNDLKGGTHTQFHVNFLKDKGNTFDVSLSAMGTKDLTVAVKKDEITCGKGTEVGFVKKIKNVDQPYLLIYQTYREFLIICENPNFKNVAGPFYVHFKNFHLFKEGMPADVLESDIKLQFDQ